MKLAMGEWIDISVSLSGQLPTWPGSPGFRSVSLSAIAAGEEANVTEIAMDVHTGTHVDAPRHFIADGLTTDRLGLEPFVGRAEVVSTGSASEITAAVLEGAGVAAGAKRLLLRTINSDSPDMYEKGFDSSYAALTLDGAEWLREREIGMIGIDYLSIQSFTASNDVHRSLLGSGIAILEGISLASVAPGSYELMCLPLRLRDAEAAPARAILRPLQARSEG